MSEGSSEFESIKNLLRFLRHHKSGSKGTERIYLRHVRDFCKHVEMNPDQLVRLERSKIEELVQQYGDLLIERSRKRGRSVRNANVGITTLKTFFRVNGFNRQNALELRITCYRQPPRVRNLPEYVPDLREALRMAERAGSKRNRAIIYTLMSTGLRNSTLRALTYKDVKDDLQKEQNYLLIIIRPEMKSIIDSACKNEIPYYVFTSEQATRAIREYIEERIERYGAINDEEPIEERIERYGAINDEEPLFVSDHNLVPRDDRRKRILSARGLQMIVHNAAKEAEIKDWKWVCPHALRKVFERVLRSRLSDGSNLDPKDQEFLMGHILAGSQDAYYDRTKIEEMRTKYEKLVFEDAIPEEIMKLQITREIAKSHGINPDEIRCNKEKELVRKLRPDEEKLILEDEIKQRRQNGERKIVSKIVKEDELELFLSSGWRVKCPLNNGKVVIETDSESVRGNPNAPQNDQNEENKENLQENASLVKTNEKESDKDKDVSEPNVRESSDVIDNNNMPKNHRGSVLDDWM